MVAEVKRLSNHSLQAKFNSCLFRDKVLMEIRYVQGNLQSRGAATETTLPAKLRILVPGPLSIPQYVLINEALKATIHFIKVSGKNYYF